MSGKLFDPKVLLLLLRFCQYQVQVLQISEYQFLGSVETELPVSICLHDCANNKNQQAVINSETFNKGDSIL